MNKGVKVLQLEGWMKKPDHPGFPKLDTETPRFNRDGYYLDGDICWFEYNGIAYLYDAYSFKYSLMLMNVKVLMKKQMDSIKVLIDYNMCPQSLRVLYSRNKDILGSRKSTLEFKRRYLFLIRRKE